MQPVVKSEKSVPMAPVERAVKTYIQWLIDRRDGAPNFELRKFTISPRGEIPPHMHPDIEHIQYVLKGSYRVRLGDREVVVKEGDALLIPAGTVHSYVNDGDSDAEFLCIIPRTSKYKTIWLEEKQPNRC